MLVPLNELKARFQNRDTPSAKDFEDLIDTLAAIASGSVNGTAIANGSIGEGHFAALTADKVGYVFTVDNDTFPRFKILPGLPPNGAAGGHLAGSYPDPEIRSSAIDDNARPIVADMVKDTSLPVAKIDPEAAGVGSMISVTTGGVAWVEKPELVLVTTANQEVLYTGGTVDWTEVTCSTVPDGTHVVLVEVKSHAGSAGDAGSCDVKGRTSAADPELQLSILTSQDPGNNYSVVERHVKISATKKFEVKVGITTAGSAEIKLIGYY